MLLGAIKSNAQLYSTITPQYSGSTITAEWRGFNSIDVKVVSKYDTTVLFIGMEICTHDWVTKDNGSGYMGIRYTSCAVVHGAGGCPDTWGNYNSICTKCLRHINVKESRVVQGVKSKYDEALDRLNKLKQ